MSIPRSLLLAAVLILAPGAFSQDLKNETDFRVKLLGPISTETNQKGDKITAQVLAPPTYKGDIMEGEIREAKSGGKIKSKSVLNFQFDTLHHGGKDVKVQSSVKAMYNSKGKENVDEEGRVISKKNNLGKAAAGTAGGAVLGGILGGAKGAAIGAGVGAAASLVLIQVAAEGANVKFDAGSEFDLAVKARE